ncbi:MAG: hypothetical protein ACYCV7_11245, partial [Acidimicrobiales bacterium]
VNGSVSVSNFPKTQGVNGTVNVGNLPVNSAGQLKVAPTGSAATTTSSSTAFSGTIYLSNSSPTVLNVTGSGKLLAIDVKSQNGQQVRMNIYSGGAQAWSQSTAGGCCWAPTPDFGWSGASGGSSMWFTPPSGLSFQSSLRIVLQSSANVTAQYRGVYSIAS